MADIKESGRGAQPSAPDRPQKDQWTSLFLAELAATSNVSASARRAGVPNTLVYETRRTDPAFNRAWRLALCEGYDALEMALLQRLREGEIKPASGAKKGVRTYDNASALRLLTAHRDTVAREKAQREDEDAEAIIASINAKLEKMRERSLAAKAQNDAQNDAVPDGE
jgi:hypothetical protein